VKVENHTVEVFQGAPPSPAKCTVMTSKGILVALLAGALDPMIAMMCGQVAVDDLNELVAFSNAFDLNRAKFEEFQQQLSKATTEDAVRPADTPAPADIPESPVHSPVDHATAASEVGIPAAVAQDARKREPANLAINDRIKMTLSRGGLSLLVTLRKMQTELDKSERWQAAVAGVSSAASKVAEAPPIKGIRRVAPSPPGVTGGIATAAKATGVSAIEVLAKNAQHPTVEQAEQRVAKTEQKKQSLQNELSQLREANRLKALERARAKEERAAARASPLQSSAAPSQ